MTDRVKGCTIVFKDDIREEDAASMLGAFRQFSLVAEVAPEVTTSADYFARARVSSDIRAEVVALIERLSDL
jgi:hypothetical protein